jgi:molybdopterin/thiamine biosynthesis adenylyltransferase/proteasome lid subunit RPN8/RPN11
MRQLAGPPATFVLPQAIAEELQHVALNPLETAGVLIGRLFETPDGGIRLIARKIVWVDRSSYLRRESDSLSIASDGYVHALREAEDSGSAAVWLHTHPGPGSLPIPSSHDKLVDSQIADLFRLRSGSEYYGAIVVSPRSEGFTFTGYLESSTGRIDRVERVWIVGDRLRLIHSFDRRRTGLSSAFDRNVRAFGGAVQETLGDLRVAIAGCGGTGSVVAEQLVRLGVRRFTIIDSDVLSESNVTRVYGSYASDVGRRKVEILADHLNQIAPDAEIETVHGMVTRETIARRLLGADVIFGCTDDNAGRLVLSRVASYLMTPVIDSGVLVSSGEGGQLQGIDGRVTVLVPGQACLICRGRIDLARASSELLTPDERLRRVDEGYAPALARVEPAVVTFTTAVGAAAVSELLERLIGFGPNPRPTEVLLRFHDREISTNVALPMSRHYCDPLSGKLGMGVTHPFLDQTWLA